MKFALAAALLAALTLAPATARTTGGVCGHVKDDLGQAVAGARVPAEAASAEESRTTDAAGWYCFLALPPDQYKMEYQANGLNPMTWPTEIHANQQIRINPTRRANVTNIVTTPLPWRFWDATSYWGAEINMLAPLAASPDSIAGALRATAGVQLGSIEAQP